MKYKSSRSSSIREGTAGPTSSGAMGANYFWREIAMSSRVEKQGGGWARDVTSRERGGISSFSEKSSRCSNTRTKKGYCINVRRASSGNHSPSELHTQCHGSATLLLIKTVEPSLPTEFYTPWQNSSSVPLFRASATRSISALFSTTRMSGEFFNAELKKFSKLEIVLKKCQIDFSGCKS